LECSPWCRSWICSPSWTAHQSFGTACTVGCGDSKAACESSRQPQCSVWLSELQPASLQCKSLRPEYILRLLQALPVISPAIWQCPLQGAAFIYIRQHSFMMNINGGDGKHTCCRGWLPSSGPLCYLSLRVHRYGATAQPAHIPPHITSTLSQQCDVLLNA